jgi:hypothetical protein
MQANDVAVIRRPGGDEVAGLQLLLTCHPHMNNTSPPQLPPGDDIVQTPP